MSLTCNYFLQGVKIKTWSNRGDALKSWLMLVLVGGDSLLLTGVYLEVKILPVTSGRNEVYAAVDPGVWNLFLPVDVDFFLQVGLILVIDELHDRLPTEKGEEVVYCLLLFNMVPVMNQRRTPNKQLYSL